MQRIGERLVFSASDLNNFLECAHLSELERRFAFGEIARPDPSPSAALIASKGDEHERRHLDRFKERYGSGVVSLERPHAGIASFEEAQERTIAAMDAGAEIIYQGTFFDGEFLGHADFLRRVPKPCTRWPWSYEVIDTKLAHNAKPYFLVQLCNYSEHVARIQGTPPARASIIAGSGIEQPFTLHEYMAYYRHLKDTFLARLAAESNGTYPHEVSHCQICRWNPVCEARRDRDDYLGIVATMRRDGIAKLHASGIETIAALARASDAQRPAAMATETFERLRAQAALQRVQRTTGDYVYELLPFEERRGLALLPEPDAGDVFFDMEGDPFYTAERALEYLFGIYLPREDRYLAFWARSGGEERGAFESLVDFLQERRAKYPSMHVYHYAPYETTGLKRLSGLYATREEQLDGLLRAQAFVDLYAVVRQGLRISQPSYSIKKLEPFYGFTRSTKTQRGDDSILMFESWLIDGDDNILVDIENYNRDDCISTHRLREWLLGRRAELAARDGGFPWKAPPFARKEEPRPEDEERTKIRDALLADLQVPASLRALRDSDERLRARWLLGHLLDYHRRDDKPAWWAYYYRCENRDELTDFDRHAIGGLRYRQDIAPYVLQGQRTPVYVFDFPDQLHGFEGGNVAYALDAAQPHEAGTVVQVDEDNLQVHVKLRGSVDPASLDALAPVPTIPPGAIRLSLRRVAAAYLDGSLERCHPALVDVLLRRTPRLHGVERGARVQPESPDATSITDLARRLDESFLFVQGPPGTGKSTAGAGVILNLIAAGKRVAILANSHKVIHNLLHKIEGQAAARGQRFVGIQRYSESTPGSRFESTFERSSILCADGTDALDAPHDLAAGTAWTFAREQAVNAYDYLFIDEAGQVSLANAIACAPCARNLVLLGDPLQLAQVSQGTHPPGVELSVMEHLLGDDATVPPDRGVFLDCSHRMHPTICDFISASVYGGRLMASERTRCNRVDSPALSGSGLRYLAVDHQGNQRESREEADRIVQEIGALLQGRVRIAAPNGDATIERGCVADDVLVVTPYNAQRRLIAQRLSAVGIHGVRVGTVDKFQGQEAAVVFYSMATSTGEDVPRGVGFLFEKNRFNVAISRAQCMTVLVASPRLLEIRCSTPQQMALVNLLCRYVEAAEPIDAPSLTEFRALRG
jgi:predicted RecB family nuclease